MQRVIWGWSQNGLVAYAERFSLSTGGWKLNVFDMNSDRVIFKLEFNDESAIVNNEQRHNEFLNSVRETLARYNIVEHQTEQQQFPINRSDTVFNARIDIVTKYEIATYEEWFGEDDDGNDLTGELEYYVIDENEIFTYRVILAENNGQSKVAATLTSESTIMGVGASGYYMSPYENRILIVINEDIKGAHRNFSATRYVGAHLETGFR